MSPSEFTTMTQDASCAAPKEVGDGTSVGTGMSCSSYRTEGLRFSVEVSRGLGFKGLGVKGSEFRR